MKNEIEDIKDIERIGEKSNLFGVFELVKTLNIFKYAPQGMFTRHEFFKTFNASMFLSEEGMYMGKGNWLVKGGDIFRVAKVEADKQLLFTKEHSKPVEEYHA